MTDTFNALLGGYDADTYVIDSVWVYNGFQRHIRSHFASRLSFGSLLIPPLHFIIHFFNR